MRTFDSRRGKLICLVLAATACLLAAVPSSRAGAAGPLGLTDCGPIEGVYQCEGLVKTWDGVPLDTTVTMPREGVTGKPLLAEIHGFGNSKWEYLNPDETAYTDNAYSWARDGYVVLTYTARGLWGSCGTPESRLANPADCATGYIHLADTRYEARDTQELIGRLVDEGVADPDKLAVFGDSYGGGQSLELASLNDRTMLPDGSLVPWRSPSGTPLRLAAAAPVIPWVDLVNAAAPNGRSMTQSITPRSVATQPVGIEKASFVNGIFLAAQTATGPGQPLGEPFVPGRPMGFLAPGGIDPSADVAGWVARTDQGEPYTDQRTKEVVAELTNYHSAYYIPANHSPPPMLLASGFTDDLFPVDEVVRYANRSYARHPKTRLRLLLGDFGHQRASNDSRDRDRLLRSLHRLFDYYLKGEGRPLHSGVTAYVQRCPREKSSGGPFRSRWFSQLARGEVRFRTVESQSVGSESGDPDTAVALDPVAGMGDGCVVLPSDKAADTATYELDSVKRSYTLIGAPTVRAKIQVSGAPPHDAAIVARLWDVDEADGTQRLVARGLWRPDNGRNLLQLHPAAWAFRRGHHPKLELLGNDAPFARPSNATYTATVERLRLRLPVQRRADCDQVTKLRSLPLIKGTKRAPGALITNAKKRCRS